MPTQSGGIDTIISSNAFGKFQTQEHVENDNLWNVCVSSTLATLYPIILKVFLVTRNHYLD